jgi:uncharacterized alpha-E superfamily protein
MLSRVADNLYWGGRYLQRAESTARLVTVNGHLLLDLPRQVQAGWLPLIEILGVEKQFKTLYPEAGDANEANVVRFLLNDERSASSILSSVRRARESLRTVRDTLPQESWEKLNDLHLMLQADGEKGLNRRYRQEFLQRVIDACLLLFGVLTSNMSRDTGFQFLRLGTNVEQADMTTRILDVRSVNLIRIRGADDLAAFENIQWMSVLRSLTAYEMYRRLVRERVQGDSVLRFLLQDREFPRSVAFCLMRMQRTLPKLPEKRSVERSITRTLALLRDADVDALLKKGLSEFLDEVQVGIKGINDALSEAYFKA